MFENGRTEEAFGAIVDTYKEKLYWHIRRMAGSHEDTDDILQNVFMKIWTGLPSFRGESRLFTWIYRIALNTCISGQRKRKRQHSVPLTMDINLFEDGDDDTLQVKMLYERISSLGLYDRALILLWLDNMSYEEIGAVMGISEKNVSVRLVRIKEKLKNINDK